MHTITIDKALRELEHVIKRTIESREETVISTSMGAIVMIPEDEWNSIMETLHLLQDKKSLAALLDGHRHRDNGNKPESLDIEDVFSDVQD